MPNTQITDIKEIAKLVRADIAAAIKAGKLPALKVSVRLERYSMGRSLHVTVTGVPAGFRVANEANVKWSAENPHLSASFHAPEEARSRYNEVATRALDTLNSIVAAYNWNRSDTQSDHFDVNFYAHVQFDWKLEATERKAPEAAA